jgi:L-threonylcarbamoyladenylate synthase
VSADPLAEAVEQVRRGGLLAFPTETVWGLGADARSDAAVAALQRWKHRAASAPISILVAGADAGAALASLERLGFAPDPVARKLALRFWPGPLTLVLAAPRGRGFARGVARADGAVGVRCSSHPAAAALAHRLAEAGVGPITATSLNRSGEPAARTTAEARAVCGSAPDAPRLLGLPDDAEGLPESTLVDVSGARPAVLRAGAIGADALDTALALALDTALGGSAA